MHAVLRSSVVAAASASFVCCCMDFDLLFRNKIKLICLLILLDLVLRYLQKIEWSNLSHRESFKKNISVSCWSLYSLEGTRTALECSIVH